MSFSGGSLNVGNLQLDTLVNFGGLLYGSCLCVPLIAAGTASPEVRLPTCLFVCPINDNERQYANGDHPEHRTPGDLLTAFGIDPHDFDGCL